jgi:hypothetical protein
VLLGSTTYVSPNYALSISSIGRSGGMIDPRRSARTASSVDMSNPRLLTVSLRGGDFGANMMVDGTTHAPTRLVFPGSDRTEVVIAFDDRRETGGMMMPHHIGTTVGSRVLDDLRFRRGTGQSGDRHGRLHSGKAPLIRHLHLYALAFEAHVHIVQRAGRVRLEIDLIA